MNEPIKLTGEIGADGLIRLPIICVDQPLEGRHVVAMISDLVRLAKEHHATICDIRTTGFSNDPDGKFNNQFQLVLRLNP